MPLVYGWQGGNSSPHFSWSGAPEGTVSFVLIMDDTDVGNPQGTDFFCHWIVFNIPAAVFGLAENQPFTATLSNGAKQGQNGYGTIGYGGPDPPPGEVHHYRFRLYALDIMLDLASEPTGHTVMDAIEGHVLGQVDYTGTYTG
jgi:Raf kinase inhibitor-like YbhB/YbcL family protein